MLFRCFLVSYIYLNIFEEYLGFCAIRSYKSSFFVFLRLLFLAMAKYFYLHVYYFMV